MVEPIYIQLHWYQHKDDSLLHPQNTVTCFWSSSSIPPLAGWLHVRVRDRGWRRDSTLLVSMQVLYIILILRAESLIIYNCIDTNIKTNVQWIYIQSTCLQTYYPSWKLITAFVPSLWLCQSPSTDLLISTQSVINWEGRPLNSINFRPKSLSKGKGWFGFRKLEVEGRRDGRSEAALWSKASKMALNVQRHSSVRTTLYQRVLSNICKQ